ncbi:major facilitator superfamily MFS_1 [Pseudofrankia inefficax]|uniref:Major facilitator superfamily MFS_1 n=1 Tax=Pseudofrankia inefficax (strain DSM 45817 / CECT 9037 / DDB 130130 / EuI1c) TaxID=298654 RepID=E3J358_PSEI1|nr:major facilitator superfamily MFS_1 [Pseudofrankia inefficax]
MTLLRDRRFRLLWSGQLLSNIGDWFLVVAVPVYVFQLTGSTLGTGLALVTQMVPALIWPPLAGVLVDRMDRLTVMIAADVARAWIMLLLVLAEADRLWLVYVVLLAQASLAQFFLPARQAVIPAVVGRGKELGHANAWFSLSGGIMRIAGAPLGGLVYATAGFHAAVLADSASYAISASTLVGVRALSRSPGTACAATRPAPHPQAAVYLREAVAFLRGHRVLWGLLLVSAVFEGVDGALNVLLVPYAVHTLNSGSGGVGLLFAALGGGFLLSAPVGRWVAEARLLRVGVAACLAVIDGCFAVLFHTHAFAVALVAIGIVGVPGGAFVLVVQVELQRGTPSALLGRIGSAFAAAQMTAALLGATLSSVAVRPLGLTVVADAAVVVLLLGAAAAVALLPAGPVRARAGPTRRRAAHPVSATPAGEPDAPG